MQPTLGCKFCHVGTIVVTGGSMATGIGLRCDHCGAGFESQFRRTGTREMAASIQIYPGAARRPGIGIDPGLIAWAMGTFDGAVKEREADGLYVRREPPVIHREPPVIHERPEFRAYLPARNSALMKWYLAISGLALCGLVWIGSSNFGLNSAPHIVARLVGFAAAALFAVSWFWILIKTHEKRWGRMLLAGVAGWIGFGIQNHFYSEERRIELQDFTGLLIFASVISLTFGLVGLGRWLFSD